MGRALYRKRTVLAGAPGFAEKNNDGFLARQAEVCICLARRTRGFVLMSTWWSKTILGTAFVAIVLLPSGALGSRTGLWGYEVGFLFLILAGVLAIIGLGGAIAGVLAARRRSLGGDLWASAAGLIGCFGVVVFLGMQLLKALSAPLLHQVSTDIDEPPDFVEIVALRGEHSNPLDFDAETIGPMQHEYYPGVQPLILRATPEEAFARARAVLEEMGMDIVREYPDRGLIEATDSTFWFGFKDDVAVRVAHYPRGAVIDVRSISRVGLSDVGANAHRAEEILRRLSGG